MREGGTVSDSRDDIKKKKKRRWREGEKGGAGTSLPHHETLFWMKGKK